MRGLNEIHATDRKEVVLAYEKAVKSGERTLIENIRWAHPDLTKQFDRVDKELATVSA